MPDRLVAPTSQWRDPNTVPISDLQQIYPQLTAGGYWVFTTLPPNGLFQDSGNGYLVLTFGATTGKRIIKHGGTGVLFIL